jgi:hypothetical protein
MADAFDTVVIVSDPRAVPGRGPIRWRSGRISPIGLPMPMIAVCWHGGG